MNAALERLVWQRAKSRCEYCQLPQVFSPLPHAIDHIIARQHDGPTQAENPALACFFCNALRIFVDFGLQHELAFHAVRDGLEVETRRDDRMADGNDRAIGAVPDVSFHFAQGAAPLRRIVIVKDI